MEDHRKEVGQRIAALRDARGWSQEELAHRADVSVKTISRLENGRNEGRGKNLRSIAEALEVPVLDLQGTQPDPFGLSDVSQLDRIEAKLDRLLGPG